MSDERFSPSLAPLEISTRGDCPGIMGWILFTYYTPYEGPMFAD